MTDSETTLSELKAAMMQFVSERDWEQFHAPKNLSMAISAEASELMEHFLWLDPEESRGYLEKPERFEEVASELADVILFALSFANTTGIDISNTIAQKLEENARKYPVAKAKGNARKYDQL